MADFHIHFPDLGETGDDAKPMPMSQSGGSAAKAAEIAAAARCAKDVEWREHIVSVAWGEPLKSILYTVEFRTEPTFTAYERF